MILVGLLIDAAVGWPPRLYNRIGHPVTWIGGLITACEVGMNAGTRQRRTATGLLTVLIVLASTLLPTVVVQALLPGGWFGILIGGLLAWPLIAAQLAQMSLNTTDVVMMGWLGPEQLAAGALAMSVDGVPVVDAEPAVPSQARTVRLAVSPSIVSGW